MIKKRAALIKDKKPKTTWGKIWNFLWNSDSIWSWIADLILLYVIVKFIFFPALSFIFATPLPSVIVESQSMTHLGDSGIWWRNFGSWYIQNNITADEVKKWPFKDGIDKGDIMIVKGSRNKDYTPAIGEIIVFDAGQTLPVIHRVIKNETIISTKGDNNHGQLPVEKSIENSQIIGKAVFRIPKLGWAKLIFVEIFKRVTGTA